MGFVDRTPTCSLIDSCHCDVHYSKHLKMCEEAKFCILKVVKHFENSVQSSPDDVLMDEYLEGYTELNKFFALMGKVFGFVSSDVKDKVVILQTLRNGEEKDKFVSFKEMIEYERDNNLLEKKGYTSGSRTLLRLHRGLGTSLIIVTC